MLERMLDNFNLYFPSIAKHMVSYRHTDDFELTITCDDDLTFIYDDLEKSIRMISNQEGEMTEATWRREFGRRLRRRMSLMGMTQGDLATTVGITQGQLSNYITGRSMPGFFTVYKLAKALGCSTDELRYND